MLEQELIVADSATEEGLFFAFLARKLDVELHLHPAKHAVFGD